MNRSASPAKSRNHAVIEEQALALDEGVAKLLQRFKLEPSLAAGSPYAHLHASDVGLLVAIRGPEKWNVRKIAQALKAPISTISSALDRLESIGLITRQRRLGDRRVVYIELSTAGRRLVTKIRASQVENCRVMLAKLSSRERADFIRLISQLAHG